jgi:hypothetical protein
VFPLSQATIVAVTTSIAISPLQRQTCTINIAMVLSWIIKTLDRKVIITHAHDGVSILLKVRISLNPKYIIPRLAATLLSILVNVRIQPCHFMTRYLNIVQEHFQGTFQLLDGQLRVANLNDINNIFSDANFLIIKKNKTKTSDIYSNGKCTDLKTEKPFLISI